MSAPTAVALGCGPLDAPAVTTVRRIVAGTCWLRPDLRIQTAFTSGWRDSLESAVTAVSSRGEHEVVVVPLHVGPDERSDEAIARALGSAARVHPDVSVRVAEPIGVDPALLSVLDTRLRSALKQARVRELDGLVLAADGSSDGRFRTALQRLARLWSAHHHLPTTIAYAHTSPPSTGEAVRELRRQGKRHVAVGSLFLTSGPEERQAAELALEAGACVVSEPLGAHEEVSRLLVARYVVGALELVPV